ncbi:MAG TPA: nucleotide disphospho-sugar-binding domain-containing protein [Abditibacteriaceae bacterium]|jgi:UDP:flavonoid glycosyltransferase YjiC (YdhE family)
MSTRHVVLATWGSFGDLHPVIAIALELQRRGHRATLATAPLYRDKVEALGLGFHAMRPDLPPPAEAAEVIRQVMDLRHGTEYLFKQLLMPHLRQSYDDLTDAVSDADLLMTHPATLAAPLVAQKQRMRWVSMVLAPTSFFSVYDTPVLAPAPRVSRLFKLGLPVRKAFVALAKRMSQNWIRPVYSLREEIGLTRGAHPIFEGQHSPYRVLALFSRLLGEPQPDWPPNTTQTGFAFYDQRGDIHLATAESAAKGDAAQSDDVKGDTANGDDLGGLSVELRRFLESGAPPVVFTLGSSAVMDAGEFYRDSAEAARLLGVRALLLAGSNNNLPQKLPHGVAAFDYAPYSEVFPRAAAIVHQGGVGTTGQAMRAGKPMLVMPYSHDQPDHAARMAKLGIGLHIPRSRYTALNAARVLEQLLFNPEYSKNAELVGQQVRQENGVRTACDAIEEELKNCATPRRKKPEVPL